MVFCLQLLKWRKQIPGALSIFPYQGQAWVSFQLIEWWAFFVEFLLNDDSFFFRARNAFRIFWGMFFWKRLSFDSTPLKRHFLFGFFRMFTSHCFFPKFLFLLLADLTWCNKTRSGKNKNTKIFNQWVFFDLESICFSWYNRFTFLKRRFQFFYLKL